jgi:hypothetical protein
MLRLPAQGGRHPGTYEPDPPSKRCDATSRAHRPLRALRTRRMTCTDEVFGTHRAGPPRGGAASHAWPAEPSPQWSHAPAQVEHAGGVDLVAGYPVLIDAGYRARAGGRGRSVRAPAGAGPEQHGGDKRGCPLTSAYVRPFCGHGCRPYRRLGAAAFPRTGAAVHVSAGRAPPRRDRVDARSFAARLSDESINPASTASSLGKG